MSAPTRDVVSADGTSIAVYEAGGSSDARTLVAVHGYPDNHTVWDGVVAELSPSRRVVTYDVRGAGASGVPPTRDGYRMERLVDDLLAVLDTVSPDAPVDLLAHDWGSIQAWAAVADARLAGRVATFTSVSGPSLDYAARWFRDVAKHPGATLRQALHSYYIGFFQLPVLPEFVVRHGVLERLVSLTGRGSRSARARTSDGPRRGEAEFVNGIELYRANIGQRLTAPDPRRVDIPVQVITPRADAYVSAALAAQAPVPYVDDLTVVDVAGGHWIVAERPEVIAALVTDFTAGRRPVAAAGRFGGRLAVVTGGARGIGRSTAAELAKRGTRVVVADLDLAAAEATAAELRADGGDVTARQLDVSDRAAWETFATSVREEFGVPDIVVNNAGIGMGGPFLGTGVDDWAAILGVNVWGVIHGCRLFGEQMVQRGRGGQLVNIASAAAFSPSIVYPAYATTKAAVLMLSECLRAELGREGIGVTAVCPGFIDTDISRTTRHVGVDEAEAQRLREHQIASYGKRGYGPDKVARQIVKAIERDKPVALITPEARFFRTVSRVSPRLGRQIAKLDLNEL